MVVEIAGRRNSNSVANNTSSEINSSTFTTIYAGNANRIFFSVYNPDATNTVTLNLCMGASGVAGTGICIQPKEKWEMQTNNIYTGAICAISGAGTFDVMICEY